MKPRGKPRGNTGFYVIRALLGELPNPKPNRFFFATRSVANPFKISPFRPARRRGDRTAGAQNFRKF